MNIADPNSKDAGTPLEYYDPEIIMTKETVSEFIRELSELTRKYRIVIWGCGCCNSPYLGILENKEGKYEVDSDFDNLKWKLDNEDI